MNATMTQSEHMWEPNSTLDNTTANILISTPTDIVNSNDDNVLVYEYGDIMTDDYTRDLELANVPLEYLYGPIVTGFSVLSSILIAVTFLKPSMVSPTTILLTGITISRSISSLLLYGTYVYKYFAYPKQDIVYVLQYPYCIVAFVCALLKVICSSFSNCLMLFVAAQRVLVVKWPFQSRRILTNRLSCIALLLSGVISVGFKVPMILGEGTKFMTFKSYTEMRGLDVSNYVYSYYYYYYYYYYDDEYESDLGNPIYNTTAIGPLETAITDATVPFQTADDRNTADTSSTVLPARATSPNSAATIDTVADDLSSAETSSSTSPTRTTNDDHVTSTFPTVEATSPITTSSATSSSLSASSTTVPPDDYQLYTDEELEAYYNECVFKDDVDINKVIRIYVPIVDVIYLALLGICTIYLIFTLRKRGLSRQRHESKAKMQKMRNLNLCVVIVLVVETVRVLMYVIMQFGSYLIVIGAIDIYDSLDESSIVRFLQARELIASLGSAINFWIYVLACETFRHEFIKMLCCQKCKKEKIAIPKELKTVSVYSSK